VLSLALDLQGTLWVGTGGGGLNRFSRSTAAFTRFTEQNGLPNDVVYGILLDDAGSLWLSTNYGLSQYDPVQETFHNFTVSDGLQSNEFSQGASVRGPQGELYFGGTNGFNVFLPAALQPNPNAPPIVLSSLTQDGISVQASVPTAAIREVTLRWPENSFEFEMAALAFGEPAENIYAHMLEGFDSDWQYTGARRDGRYANLPGGQYTLLLKAANSDQVWNNVPLRIGVSVIPPFWDTRWFQAALSLGVVALVFGSYRLRVRSIESRNR
jgi:hypothetical protein